MFRQFDMGNITQPGLQQLIGKFDARSVSFSSHVTLQFIAVDHEVAVPRKASCRKKGHVTANSAILQAPVCRLLGFVSLKALGQVLFFFFFF